MVKEIDLTNPIAAGRTAEIFAWDEKYVLKLYSFPTFLLMKLKMKRHGLMR